MVRYAVVSEDGNTIFPVYRGFLLRFAYVHGLRMFHTEEGIVKAMLGEVPGHVEVVMDDGTRRPLTDEEKIENASLPTPVLSPATKKNKKNGASASAVASQTASQSSAPKQKRAALNAAASPVKKKAKKSIEAAAVVTPATPKKFKTPTPKKKKMREAANKPPATYPATPLPEQCVRALEGMLGSELTKSFAKCAIKVMKKGIEGAAARAKMMADMELTAETVYNIVENKDGMTDAQIAQKEAEALTKAARCMWDAKKSIEALCEKEQEGFKHDFAHCAWSLCARFVAMCKGRSAVARQLSSGQLAA